MLYDKLLRDRIEDIKTVIDSHFEHAKPFILKDREKLRDNKMKINDEDMPDEQRQNIIHKALMDFENDQDLVYDNYTFKKKLEKLKKHQNEMLAADKEIEKITKCRIVCSIQSYFIFDSESQKQGKEIFYRFEEKNRNK